MSLRRAVTRIAPLAAVGVCVLAAVAPSAPAQSADTITVALTPSRIRPNQFVVPTVSGTTGTDNARTIIVYEEKGSSCEATDEQAYANKKAISVTSLEDPYGPFSEHHVGFSIPAFDASQVRKALGAHVLCGYIVRGDITCYRDHLTPEECQNPPSTVATSRTPFTVIPPKKKKHHHRHHH